MIHNNQLIQTRINNLLQPSNPSTQVIKNITSIDLKINELKYMQQQQFHLLNVMERVKQEHQPKKINQHLTSRSLNQAILDQVRKINIKPLTKLEEIEQLYAPAQKKQQFSPTFNSTQDTYSADNLQQYSKSTNDTFDTSEIDSDFQQQQQNFCQQQNQNQYKLLQLKNKNKIDPSSKTSKKRENAYKNCYNTITNEKNQTVYQCKECEYTSVYLQNFKRHYIKTHPNTNLECHICLKSFQNKQALIIHQEKVHDLKYLNCLQCDYKTKHEKLLNRHIKANHSDTVLKCPLENCKFTTNVQRYMNQHTEYSHSQTTLQCDKCQFQTTNPQSMYQHKRHMHNNSEFVCDICQFKTTNEKNLNIHKKNMHNDVVFSCDICEFQTKNRDYLKRHAKNMHLSNECSH